MLDPSSCRCTGVGSVLLQTCQICNSQMCSCSVLYTGVGYCVYIRQGVLHPLNILHHITTAQILLVVDELQMFKFMRQHVLHAMPSIAPIISSNCRSIIQLYYLYSCYQQQLQEHNCIMYIELLIEVLQLYIYSVQASTLHKSVQG